MGREEVRGRVNWRRWHSAGGVGGGGEVGYLHWRGFRLN